MPPMAMELKVDTDAEEVGFDAGRLERIDRHFARYVDEGQLPGWLIVVTRRGRVAHLSRYGHADVEAGRPVEVDTAVAHFLDDQAGHLGRGDDALRRGRLRPDRSDRPLVARVRETAGLCQGLRPQPAHRAGDRTDPIVAPAHPYLGPDLRVPPRASRRRDVPRGRVRMGHAARTRSGRVRRAMGAVATGVPAGQRMELFGLFGRARQAGRSRVRATA